MNSSKESPIYLLTLLIISPWYEILFLAKFPIDNFLGLKFIKDGIE